MPLKSDSISDNIIDSRSVESNTYGLHPKSMSVYNSYSLVKRAGPGIEAFNFQQFITITPQGTWICCWTQGSTEAAPDQRVVCARSIDNGISWSKEIIIESASPKYKVPAWVVPFTVLSSGRIYMFYWYNYNDDPIRDGGSIFFRFSDDDGLNWSNRHMIDIPRTNIDDVNSEVHGWNFGPFVMMPNGKPIMSYNKIRRSSMLEDKPDKWETEVFFMECDNILWETNPEKLIFNFFPVGDHGLFVKHPLYGQNFGQEATIVPISNNRLLAVFRTRTGYLYFSTSETGAKSWSKPEPFRLSPNGQIINQPCAPAPIKKLKDGRILLLYHNTQPDESGWYPRHPLWILVGREAPCAEKNGGIIFSKPRILLYNDGLPSGTFNNNEIAYPEVFEWSGKVFVSYSSKTEEVRISEIDPELIDDFGLPIY